MKTKIENADEISIDKNYRYPISRSWVVVLFWVLVLGFITGCSVVTDTDPLPEPSVDHSVITLTSTDFTDGGDFPLANYGDFASYTEYPGAGNLSPQLSWEDDNSEVKSHILLMVDRSASNWVHWFRVNITGNSLAQGVGNTAVDNQGFVTHHPHGGTERRYYGPQPPSGTHEYDILMFGVDQEAVDISGLDYAAMTGIYTNLIKAYADTSSTPQKVALAGTTNTIRILSKGKITGTATKPKEPLPAVTTIVVSSTDFTNGGGFLLTNYGDFTSTSASYTEYSGASNRSPQLSWVETNTNVKSHILLMVDRSANDWVHWFRVNIDTNFLAQGVGSTAGNDQGFVTHYNNGGTERRYYGPQPPSGTHNYDILMFGVDQDAVDISKLADYNAMKGIYSDFTAAYDNTSSTPQEVTLAGTTVRILSKGKITGTAGTP